jgi:CHAT domain-containing protein
MLTLSACGTGIGDIKSLDDVIGRTRGFLYAGVKSIVASLWLVSDDVTALLMKTVYRELKKRGKGACFATHSAHDATKTWASLCLVSF